MKGDDPSYPFLRLFSLPAQLRPSEDRRPRTLTAYHSREGMACIFQKALQPQQKRFRKVSTETQICKRCHASSENNSSTKDVFSSCFYGTHFWNPDQTCLIRAQYTSLSSRTARLYFLPSVTPDTDPSVIIWDSTHWSLKPATWNLFAIIQRKVQMV